MHTLPRCRAAVGGGEGEGEVVVVDDERGCRK